MRYVGLQVNWAGTISAASSTLLHSGAARQPKSPKKLGPVFGQRNKLFNCVFYARATVPSPASGPARHPLHQPQRRGRALEHPLHPLVLPLLFVAHAPFSDSRSGGAIQGGPGCCFGCSRTASLGASARSGRWALCKCERSCNGEGHRQRDSFNFHGRFPLVVVQE
jgi:hypothetical protein